jgi:hypothetical protein
MKPMKTGSLNTPTMRSSVAAADTSEDDPEAPIATAHNAKLRNILDINTLILNVNLPQS